MTLLSELMTILCSFLAQSPSPSLHNINDLILEATVKADGICTGAKSDDWSELTNADQAAERTVACLAGIGVTVTKFRVAF
jgi:hypothetical protein